MNDAHAPTRRNLKSEAARRRLCVAMVEALDRHGYAEASIARVQELSGMSRGALTHHFASKTLLIEATVDHLFEGAVGGAAKLHASVKARLSTKGREADWPAFFKAYCHASWSRILETMEGRALIEILVATRTDGELRDLLEPRLQRWDAAISDGVAQIFVSERGDADLRLVWGICRTFFRGLMLHERFLEDRGQLPEFVERFAEMVAPHLQPRDPNA